MKSLLSFKLFTANKRARLCLALLYLFMPVLLLAQQTYFEKRIDFNNNYDRAQNIMPVDSGFVVAGITEDSIYYYNYHLSFIKIDSTGNVMLQKEFGHDTINMLTGNPGAFIQYNNNFFIVGAKQIFNANWVHEDAMLIYFNANLDALWSKYYGEKIEPYDTLFAFFQIEKTISNSLIMTGVRMPEHNPSRIWLLKTDSLGNKLWERFYGEGEEYFQGHSVVQTNDGGYVIGGFKFVIGYDYTADPLIIKTDSLGNEEWRINPGNPNVGDHKVMVALAQDGNIIAGTNYGTEQSGDNRWAVVKIMKITPGGTVLWDNNYLEPQFDNFLQNTTVLSNGNIIVNGSSTQSGSGPYIFSYILSLDSLGNQLWYKEYTLLTGDNSFNDLYDVRETPDGGLIGVGKVDPSYPDTGTNDIWVMKMDSVGCLWAGCDTTVMVENNDNGTTGFVVYPNPVQNSMVVKLAAEPETEMVFSIFSILGTKAKETAIPPGSKSVKINITLLPNGVYLGVLSSKGKTTGRRKFVIKH